MLQLLLRLYVAAVTGILLARAASDSCTDVEVGLMSEDGCGQGWPRVLPCLRCNSSSYVIDINWNEVQSDDTFVMKVLYGDITRRQFCVKKDATGFVIPINKDIYMYIVEQIRFEKWTSGCAAPIDRKRVMCYSKIKFHGCKPTYTSVPTTSSTTVPIADSYIISTWLGDLPTFDLRWIAAIVIPLIVIITIIGSCCYVRRGARRFTVFILNYSENEETIGLQKELRENVNRIPSILVSTDISPSVIFANSCFNKRNTCYIVITRDEYTRIREDRSHVGANNISFCGILKGCNSLNALHVSGVDNVLVVHNHDDPYFMTCNVRNGTTLGNAENIAISADDRRNSTKFDNTTDNSPSINVEELAKWPCFCYPHDKTKIDQWILAVFKNSQLMTPTVNMKNGYTKIKRLNRDFLTGNPQTNAQTECDDVGDTGNDESVLDHDLV